MKKEFKFQNGATLKDKITGFVGVVMSRGDYITGCNRYGLLRKSLTEKGGVFDWVWFDESRLEMVGEDVLDLDAEVKKPGGPCDASQVPPSN